MIAFLFLSYGDIVHIDLWRRYFAACRADTDTTADTAVWIHRADGIESSAFDGAHVIPSRPTSWGTYSLVEAHLQLIRHAAGADSYVLVSGDSIPVQPLEALKADLRNDSWIDWERKGPYCGPPRNPFATRDEITYWAIRGHDRRATTVNAEAIPPHWNWVWHKASQWCVLSAHHASLLCDNETIIASIFRDSVIPDEHVVPTVLHALLGDLSSVRRRSAMFSNFAEATLPCPVEHHCVPVTYHMSNIARGIGDALAQHCHFLRKVCSTVALTQ